MATSRWVRDSLKNRNFLAPNGFKLTLELFPKVSFFCQSANIPGINIESITIPTPYRDYPVPGTETNFEDLAIKFLIDEDLQNYTSLHEWIRRTGLATGPDSTEEPQVSRGLLEILDSNFNPNFYLDFQGLWPVSLTTLDFDATVSDTEYLSAQAVFRYAIYNIKDKNGVVIS